MPTSTRVLDDKMFDSYLDITEASLSISKLSELRNWEIEKLLHCFNTYGFVIVQCVSLDNSIEDFLLLTEIFGNLTRHNRADERGIVPIRPMAGYSEYLGASNEPHFLHTDGPFEKNPPKVMALQCEVPDPIGGFSLLVSSKAIYKYLAEQDYNGLKLLFDPNIFSIKRDNQFHKRAIFNLKNNRVEMAFRDNDGKASVSVLPEASRAFNLIREFVNNPKNQIVFKLEKGQILITDNTSVLHGRTGFSINSTRKLNRLNFDGLSQYYSRLLFGFKT
ncbi:MAG: TauD/TfdA family dioxygenase [Moorea sp. SIO2I5]|nr:TauD/TfdA family dioxygenase [Moorena sp. SIO2I5]